MLLLSDIISQKILDADSISDLPSAIIPVKIYSLISELPLSDNSIGTKVLVLENDTLYIWLGDELSSGWYKIVTTSPV